MKENIFKLTDRMLHKSPLNVKIKHIKNHMLHNFNCKTSPVFEKTVPICAHKQLLMDDEWSPILCDCDGFLTSGQNRCPLPSTDLLSGHRASTLPWDLSPFKVNSLKITQGQTFCLFQNKSFWIFKRGLLLSDFCDNFFPRPRDTKMMSLWLY